MNNQRITSSAGSRQALNKRKPVDPGILWVNIQSEDRLKSSVASLSKTDREILHQFLKGADQFPDHLYLSQITISKRANKSLSTVKRAIVRFISLGIIKKIRNPLTPFNTCDYYLAPQLSTRPFRKLIMGSILCMSLLMSYVKAAPDGRELPSKVFWLLKQQTTRAKRGVRGEMLSEKKEMYTKTVQTVGLALKLSPDQMETVSRYPEERLVNVMIGYQKVKNTIRNPWGWFLKALVAGYEFKTAVKTRPQTTARPIRTEQPVLSTVQKMQKLQQIQPKTEERVKETPQKEIESIINSLRDNPTKIKAFMQFGFIGKTFDELPEDIQAQFLTNDPWFAEVVGRKNEQQVWEQKQAQMVEAERYEESLTQYCLDEYEEIFD